MYISAVLFLEVKCVGINLGVTIFFFHPLELETGIHG